MPNEKSLENLKNGKRTQFNGDTAVENQRKSAESRKRNNTIRKLGQQMLEAKMEVDAQTLKSIKRMGFDGEKPELQMLLLARIGAIAIGKDAKLAMEATQLLMEITGNDVRSINAAEQRAIERERLAMEREKVESANRRDGEVPVLIDRRPRDE